MKFHGYELECSQSSPIKSDNKLTLMDLFRSVGLAKVNKFPLVLKQE